MAGMLRPSDGDEDNTVNLLARARAGDREAFELLFDRHVPLLRRWAAGRLPRWARDAADTSDIVQETVLQTLKSLDAFEPRFEGALQAYLRHALMNRVRNALKKAVGRPTAAGLQDDLAATGISPLDALIARERLEQYESALQCLAREERDAIVGRMELGLSYAELAQALGRPSADAARMLVVRAVTKLATTIGAAR